MTFIPTHFINSVVALGVPKNSSCPFWTGTGFFVGKKLSSNPEKSFVFLITNKHVVANKSILIARFSTDSNSVEDFQIELFDNNQNKNFSEHDTADVVAILINPNIALEKHAIVNWFDLDEDTLTTKQMTDTGVIEGSLVYTMGFPMSLVEMNKKRPICRLGCISRIADENDTPMNLLIDAQVFPGNSGGPVINRPEITSVGGTPYNTKANLIGVVYAYIPYEEHLLNMQTNEIVSKQVDNSGLALVCPVNYIREVITKEINRNNLETNNLS